MSLSRNMVHLDPEKISLSDARSGTRVGYLLETNIDLLRQKAKNLTGKLTESGGAGMLVRLMGIVENDPVKLTLSTDESYSLNVIQANDTVSLFIIYPVVSLAMLRFLFKLRSMVSGWIQRSRRNPISVHDTRWKP